MIKLSSAFVEGFVTTMAEAGLSPEETAVLLQDFAADEGMVKQAAAWNPLGNLAFTDSTGPDAMESNVGKAWNTFSPSSPTGPVATGGGLGWNWLKNQGVMSPGTVGGIEGVWNKFNPFASDSMTQKRNRFMGQSLMGMRRGTEPFGGLFGGLQKKMVDASNPEVKDRYYSHLAQQDPRLGHYMQISPSYYDMMNDDSMRTLTNTVRKERRIRDMRRQLAGDDPELMQALTNDENAVTARRKEYTNRLRSSLAEDRNFVRDGRVVDAIKAKKARIEQLKAQKGQGMLNRIWNHGFGTSGDPTGELQRVEGQLGRLEDALAGAKARIDFKEKNLNYLKAGVDPAEVAKAQEAAAQRRRERQVPVTVSDPWE